MPWRQQEEKINMSLNSFILGNLYVYNCDVTFYPSNNIWIKKDIPFLIIGINDGEKYFIKLKVVQEHILGIIYVWKKDTGIKPWKP